MSRGAVLLIGKHVVFHNGKTMTAKDVIASLNHHRGEDSKSAARVTVDPIKSLTAPDPHTLAVELESGNADLPFLVSDHHLVVMPSKDGKVDVNSHNEGGSVIPMFANYVNACSDKLAHGPVVGGNIDLDGMRLAERRWSAA